MPTRSSMMQNGTTLAQQQMKVARPRRPSSLLLASLIPPACWLVFRSLISPSVALPSLHTALAFSIVAAISVAWLIPRLGRAFVGAGLKGKDLLKDRDEVVPESIGLICASVYILLLILFIPFLFSDAFVNRPSNHNLEGLAAASVEFPHQQVEHICKEVFNDLCFVACCISLRCALSFDSHYSWIPRRCV